MDPLKVKSVKSSHNKFKKLCFSRIHKQRHGTWVWDSTQAWDLGMGRNTGMRCAAGQTSKAKKQVDVYVHA